MRTIFLIILAAGSAGLAAPTEPNAALLQDQQATTSENLTAGADSLFQTKIDLARRQRAQGDFEQAEKSLVSVIESDGPKEFQRTALLELAITAHRKGQLPRAQQIYSQFLQRYPEDPSGPEVLLRQGLLYREMGAHTMALAKFYAVMTTVLNMKLDTEGHYRRLVVQAQTEIADTHYLQEKFTEGAEFFERLLKLDSPVLNRAQIQLKLVRCLGRAQENDKVVDQAQDFLTTHLDSVEQSELRFLLTVALQRLGRKAEALQQALLLVQAPQTEPHWRQRLGNEVANQFYNDGEYPDALALYLALAQADSSPRWQLPLFYQAALIYERLHQPEKAAETYALIIKREADLGKDADPTLKTVLDMARWRKNYLAWQTEAQQASRTFRTPPAPSAPPIPR